MSRASLSSPTGRAHWRAVYSLETMPDCEDASGASNGVNIVRWWLWWRGDWKRKPHWEGMGPHRVDLPGNTSPPFSLTSCMLLPPILFITYCRQPSHKGCLTKVHLLESSWGCGFHDLISVRLWISSYKPRMRSYKPNHIIFLMMVRYRKVLK